MSNLFCDDQDLSEFINGVRNGEINIEKEAQFVGENYPKYKDDLEFRYDAEENKTTASYKGKDLFEVIGQEINGHIVNDTVYDLESKNEIRADASFRNEYLKQMGEEAIQKGTALDYFDFKQAFSKTYNNTINDLIRMSDKLQDIKETFDIGYNDVSIENNQGCYVTATIGDKKGDFAIYSANDERFKDLVDFVKDNAKQKEITPNSLNAEQAILLADMHELKDEDRAEFLLKTLDENIFEADDPYYQPVLDYVKEQLEEGEDPESTGIPLTFEDETCNSGHTDNGTHAVTECKLEELLTEKGSDELNKIYSVFYGEGWILSSDDKEEFKALADFVHNHFEDTSVELQPDGGETVIEISYGDDEVETIPLNRGDNASSILEIAEIAPIKEGHVAEVADACELKGEERAEFLKKHGKEEKHSMKM